jgi:Catalase
MPESRRPATRYHFKTVQGIENFTDDEAKALVADEPNFHLRDLYDAIAQRDAPEWRLEMQIMPFEEAADYRFNPFDLTKVWPHGDYSPVTIGRMVLVAIRRTTSPRSSRRRSSRPNMGERRRRPWRADRGRDQGHGGQRGLRQRLRPGQR